MADVKRYTDQEIADAYTRVRMAIKGQQVNVVEYVLASDYDALAAELAEVRQRADNRTAQLNDAEARIAALTKFAEFCDYHHRSCTGLQGQHLECDCGYSAARDEMRAALNSSASETEASHQ